MNTNSIFSRGGLSLALGVFVWAAAGCKHTSPRKPNSISETPAPAVKSAPRPPVDARERELQGQIDLMQEQIRALAARTDALAAFHGGRMPPKWIEKVQAARAEASRPADRVRYLEAARALLARQLQALRAEMKVYEAYEASDVAIPRP